jgi:hypothetical protein
LCSEAIAFIPAICCGQDLASYVLQLRQGEVAMMDFKVTIRTALLLVKDDILQLNPELKIILHSAAIGIPESEMNSVDSFVAKGDGVARLLEEVSVLAQPSAAPIATVIASEACQRPAPGSFYLQAAAPDVRYYPRCSRPSKGN